MIKSSFKNVNKCKISTKWCFIWAYIYYAQCL